MDKKLNFLKTNNYSTYILLIILVCILLAISFIYQNHINNVNELNKLIYEQGNGRFINTNDTFIGTSLTIIGILVTFVIGYQIFNAIELKKDIENQKKELSTDWDNFKNNTNEKLKEYNILFVDLDRLKNEIKKNKYTSEMDMYISYAEKATTNKDYNDAFFNYFTAFAARLYIKEETKFYKHNSTLITDIDSLKKIRNKLFNTLNIGLKDNPTDRKTFLEFIVNILSNEYYKDNYPLIFSDKCYKKINETFSELNNNEQIDDNKVDTALASLKSFIDSED